MKYKIIETKRTIENPYGFIYITTCIINGKKYIGQKVFNSGSGKYYWTNYLGSGKILKRAIKTYGRENFVREILAIAYSKEELDQLEIEYIKNHNAVESNEYYNIGSGGDGGNTFAGKTDKEMNIISAKISKHSAGGNNFNARKIICLTTGKVFEYMNEVQKLYNINPSNIRLCCIGKASYIGKLSDGTPLHWAYYEDFINNTIPVYKRKSRGKKVICLTTNQVFESLANSSKYYKIKPNGISLCCYGKRYSYGELFDGTKLVWMFHNDYYNSTESEIADKLNIELVSKLNKKERHYNPRLKKVICLNTKIIFNSIKEAAKYYKISDSAISACCRNIQNSAGKDSINKENLIWMFYSDYLNSSDDLIQQKLAYKVFKKLKTIKIKKIKPQEKKVICLNTQIIYSSVKDASEINKLNNISACCKGLIKSCGKAIDGTPLLWAYYQDYLDGNCNPIYINDKFTKVICLNTKEIFNSMLETNKKYNIDSGSLSQCCSGKRKSAGKDPITNEPLRWMYYEDWLKSNKEDIENKFMEDKNREILKYIYCITTNECFKSSREAERITGVNHKSILLCCKEEQKFAGKHPITGEKLYWQYYSDYIKEHPEFNSSKNQETA